MVACSQNSIDLAIVQVNVDCPVMTTISHQTLTLYLIDNLEVAHLPQICPGHRNF